MVRSEIQEAIEALYREGMLVKAVDESGEPLLRKGQQVYKAIDGATSAERAILEQGKQGQLKSGRTWQFPIHNGFRTLCRMSHPVKAMNFASATPSIRARWSNRRR